MTADTEFWIAEVQKAMMKGGGPFIRKMLAARLMQAHNISYQEAMLNTSIAIEFDKDNKPRLFKIAKGKPGWWDLA